jgi:hypothetical protein
LSSIALLMGLLGLSYLGTLIVGGRAARGLPSGVEFLSLGFIVGPHALGLVQREVVVEFEPVVQAGLGWLAFVVGLDFGRVGGRRVRNGPLALGMTAACLVGVIVAVTVYLALQRASVAALDSRGAMLLAAGAGAVGAETTPLAVQWVAARWGARGQLTDLLSQLASADDLVPVAASGAIFALAPLPGLSVQLSASGWFLVTVGLGAILGTVTALLLRGAEGYQVWGALVGTLLLGVGTAARFGLSTLLVTFVMGVALAAVSPARRTLRDMVRRTERSVFYPLLLLTGATIDVGVFTTHRGLYFVVGAAIVARVLGKGLSSTVMLSVSPRARAAGGRLPLAMLASGPVTVCTALAFAIRFPGAAGSVLLTTAATYAIIGELVATYVLRRILVDAGEIEAGAPSVGAGA